MIKLLIYDLDGTLIDSRQDIAEAVNWTLGELGLRDLPVEKISSFVGSGVTNLMRQVLETVGAGLVPAQERATTQRSSAAKRRVASQARVAPYGGPPKGQATSPPLDRSIKLFRRRYGEHLLDHTRLYPSVRKVLEFFKDRKQAVTTNKPEAFSLKILQGLGIASYFFEVLGGDRGVAKKPAPDTLLEILRLAGVSREEAVFVGDSAMDIKAGRKAGVKTFAVTYGFGKRREIKQAGPDEIMENLEGLMDHPALKTAVIARQRFKQGRSPDAAGVRTNKDSFNRPFRRKGRSNLRSQIASARRLRRRSSQ